MSAEEVVTEELVGRVLDGRYRVIEKLGEGGMGAVYEAEQIALARRVAVKIIHPAFAGDGEIRARFAREATASGQLDGHPHVATALDFGTLPDGSLYLVMQLVKGPSLRDVCDHGRLPWERTVLLGAQIADALSAAHSKGIVHRDLKPDNVALVRREDGREIAKVLDFGIARMLEPGEEKKSELQSTQLTRVGTVMGTPGYMAPEQAVGDRVDERADLYSFGVMLYEMLVGELPFDGPDYSSILALQFSEAPKRPGDVVGEAAGIPPELDDLVVALLARQADARPANAAEVLRVLSELLRLSTVPTGTFALDAVAGARTSGTIAPGVSSGAASGSVVSRVRTRLEPLWARSVTALSAVLPPPARPHSGRLLGALLAVPLLVLSAGLVRLAARPSHASAPAVVLTRVEGAPPSAPTLSEELANQVVALVQDEDERVRDAAADAVLAARDAPGMPAYAVAVAELERGRNCRAREAAIESLAELGDARAVPVLQRIADAPRRGCGVFSTKDCHACIRGEVAEALTRLGGAAE